tara:strand:+ start:794 stop:1321 length:528 start_codon:yes stop_codon:yes gene_type:complete
MSEDNEQKTELEKCIAANILLIKDSNLDENNFQGYPKILETPVRFDLDYMLLLLDVYEGADSAVWHSIDKIEKMNFSDEKERTIAIYEELVNSGYISNSFNIHTDYEKPYFTLYDPEDDYKREYTLDDLLEEYFNGVSEEDEELLQYIYAFTISALDNAMLTDLAQKTCWQQGIY